MQWRNYWLICLGLFLVFFCQQIPGDWTSTPGQGLDPETDVAFNPVCPTGCATCSTYNGCVTCQPAHFLFLQWHGMRQTGNCVRNCPDGYFGARRRRHGKCLKCTLPKCEICSNNTTCKLCAAPFFTVNGRCVERCPKSQPYATITRQCRKRIDCELDPWSPWGPCSRQGVTCGRQMRTRQVVQEPSENGRNCTATEQYRKCKLKKCECKGKVKVDLVGSNESDLIELGTADPSLTQKNPNWKKTQKGCKQKKQKQKQDKTKKNEKKMEDDNNKKKKTTATPNMASKSPS